ncbi:MAG: MFS transporter [Actinomycetota bacterium]
MGDETRSMPRVPLAIVLVSTMVASTYTLFALAVLASPIIDDLGVSRTTVGIIGSVNTGLGALTAPLTGRVTDRIGPRRAVLGLLGLSAAAMVLVGLASNVWILLLAYVIGGVPQGGGNPATNALIASTLAPGDRGVMTGIKQSGVTLAVFISGVTMPALAEVWSWQGAYVVFGCLFLGLTGLCWALLPSDVGGPSPGVGTAEGKRAPLPPLIMRLGVYALLMGLASGAIGRFLPLFAEEQLGYSLAVAGFAASLSGLLGMGFRIAAARVAETRVAPTTLLVQLSSIGVVSSALLALSVPFGRWLLWPAVVLYALGHTAWNAVANLAVIMNVSQRDAGRASGVIILGFLMGLTIAGPATGVIVDATGRYEVAWWLSVALAGVSAAVLARRRSDEATQR